jgi:hypothetical protein
MNIILLTQLILIPKSRFQWCFYLFIYYRYYVNKKASYIAKCDPDHGPTATTYKVFGEAAIAKSNFTVANMDGKFWAFIKDALRYWVISPILY